MKSYSPEKYILLLCTLLFLVLHVQGNSYMVHIDASDEVCFHEDLTSGLMLGLHYQVVDGGFLDIDVEVRDENNMMYFRRIRSTEDKAVMTIPEAKRVFVCFGNKFSTMTTKDVQFTLEVTSDEEDEEEREELKIIDDTITEGADRLADMILEAKHVLFGIKEENTYMYNRINTHYKVNQDTLNKVSYWAMFQFFAVFCISIGQVVYYKRLFEVKRRV